MEVGMGKEIIYSKCGFHCNRCPAYKDNSATEAGRQRGSEMWRRYFGLDFKSDIVRCEGCQSSEPWKSGNILPDRMCSIRACAVHNGVPTCAHCASFPCEEYLKRVPGAGLRQQREAAANTRFTDDEYLENLEPFEGQPHLKQLHGTIRAEDIIQPKPFSAGGDIAPFPAESTTLSGKQDEMKRLHSLLSLIFAQKADNYAGQVLLERKKVYLRGVMWVIGLYGVFKDGKLVLGSAVCGDRKECSRLVRKSDNRLHGAIQEAVDSLNQFGLHVSFEPIKKSWTLTLSIDKNAGGTATLQALKTYVSNLVAKYGEPVYAGSYNLKGKAFKLFTGVDMKDL
jgi:hypothetical protein